MPTSPVPDEPNLRLHARDAPTAEPGTELDELVGLLRDRALVSLTGAGCSSESGIPDYRGPSGSQRVPTPIRYREFVTRPEARRRYWARSALGWPRMARARPNGAHRALARLEWSGRLRGLITQNVDGLHRGAGSRELVDLHGDLARVRCLDCGAAIPSEVEEGFRVPVCEACGGRLKPDVVFFGDNVPRPRVEARAGELLPRLACRLRRRAGSG